MIFDAFARKNIVAWAALSGLVAVSLLFAGCSANDDKGVTPESSADVGENGNTDVKDDSTGTEGKDTLYVIGVPGSSESRSSSSVAAPWPCGDSVMVRGGIEYETVDIGGVCVTKRNLNFKPVGKLNTLCYGDDEANCEKYGLLYDYAAAEQACPDGWRLPTKEELVTMQYFSGAELQDAGLHFRAVDGWGDGNGDDLVGFAALPGGRCDYDRECLDEGTHGCWWTSSVVTKGSTHATLYLGGDDDFFNAEFALEDDAFASVRCVKK